MAHFGSPKQPNKVLITAFKRGMAGTLALARDRATGVVRPLYYGDNRVKGMAKIWDEAKTAYRETHDRDRQRRSASYRQSLTPDQLEELDRRVLPDSRLLLMAENNIRRNFYRIMLKTAVKYGNKETKRVKRGEGPQGYLNLLWDYAGSRIRDVCKARYFFPPPTELKLVDGSEGVGYPSLGGQPAYFLNHDNLPELDFGDMIRSHLVELARQCMKYNVPLRPAKRYIDQLLNRLLPFLDYVYTGRKTGRSNFVREGLEELRDVVDRISILYGMRNGRAPSITTMVAVDTEVTLSDADVPMVEEYPDCVTEPQLENMPHIPVENVITTDTSIEEDIEYPTTPNFFTTIVGRAEDKGVDEWSDALDTLKQLLDEGILDKEDAAQILKQAKEESRRIGSAFHDFVSKGFPSPFVMSAVVHHGDEMVRDRSGLLIVSELGVAGGQGRVDLALFRRKLLPSVDEAPPQIVYEPCMVVEIKTKSAFELDIYGVRSKSEKEKNVVSEFLLERRRLTDEEWMDIRGSISPESVKQIELYSEAILNEYQRVAWIDSKPPNELIKAVVSVDSTETWNEARDALHAVIIEGYEMAMNNGISTGDVLQVSENGIPLRLVMHMVSDSCSATEVEPPAKREENNPFCKHQDDGLEFIMYLSVSGRGSPSESAATIAERWHGLKYLYDMAHYKHRDIIWFDMNGEIADPLLGKHRLRLAFHDASVQRFFKRRVKVVDMSFTIAEYLHGRQTSRVIRKLIKDNVTNAKKPIVVVSGWNSLWRRTGPYQNPLLGAILLLFLSEVSKGGTILWFNRPVPLSDNSSVYQTKCVAPFYTNSQWEGFIDRIVWNLPLPPQRSRSFTPADDCIRVSIMEAPGETVISERIHILPLEGWGETFRSEPQTPYVSMMYSKGAGFAGSMQTLAQSVDYEDVYDLLPHLQDSAITDSIPEKARYVVEKAHVSSRIQDMHESINLINFRPYQFQERLERNKRYKKLLPIDQITQKREYRTMTLGVEEPQRNTRPPSEDMLIACDVDDIDIALSEVRGLKKAISFLLNQESPPSHIVRLCEELLDIIEPTDATQSSQKVMNRLRLVRQTLENDISTQNSWTQLEPYRMQAHRQLKPHIRAHIEQLSQRHPDIMLITGNHLFLMLHAALNTIPSSIHLRTLDLLWQYLVPWHYTRLGLSPEYRYGTHAGRSVLDRHVLFERLKSRALALNALIAEDISLRSVRMGQVIIRRTGLEQEPLATWLIFQRTMGGTEMNAALITPYALDPGEAPYELLKGLISDAPFWSESDISRLADSARSEKKDIRVPLMIANQKDMQLLFVRHQDSDVWMPVGRIEYTSHAFQSVTLIRTLQIRAEEQAVPVSTNAVPKSLLDTQDLVDVALLVIRRGLGEPVNAKCHISLDHERGSYHIFFEVAEEDDNESEALALTIKSTIELVALLRKPDYQCEPVVIDGKRLIWNRFQDITYHEDVQLIRPWVERRNPFPHLAMELPPSAEDLLAAKQDFNIRVEPHHDPWVCPLRHVSKEDIERQQRLAPVANMHYLFRYEIPVGTPKRLLDETGLRHGSCWGIRIHTPHSLPMELQDLMSVRFTAAQLATLVRSSEIVYWSNEQQEWIVHSMDLVWRNHVISEAQEAWHLRRVIEEYLGQELELVKPGTYLQKQERWCPYFIIEQERVVVGLERGATKEKRERVLRERNVALRAREEVENILSQGMTTLLDEQGITPDRRLQSDIRNEIVFILEEAVTSGEDMKLTYSGAMIRRDEVGGRRVYVIFESPYDEYYLPVTPHLHDIARIEHLIPSEVRNDIKCQLETHPFRKSDIEEAVAGVMGLLRDEGLSHSKE